MTTSTIYRTTISCVPDADLSSNSRAHYMVKARKVKALRTYAWAVTRQDAPETPITGPVALTVTIGWPKGRKRQDPSNVGHCLKAIVDGMSDAKFWHDDKQVTIKEPIVQENWSDWKERGGWLHPDGVVIVDVEEVTNG